MFSRKVTCTKGKDGKLYYFKDGKRVSSKEAGGSIVCSAPPLVLTVKKARTPKKAVPKVRAAKKAIPKIRAAKKAIPKEKTYYIWRTVSLDVFEGLPIEVPILSIGTITDSELNKKHILDQYIPSVADREKGVRSPVYVDANTNRALKKFQKDRVRWTDEEWETWALESYPKLAKDMKTLGPEKIEALKKKRLAHPKLSKDGNIAIWTSKEGPIYSFEAEFPDEFIGNVTKEQLDDDEFMCQLFMSRFEGGVKPLLGVDRLSKDYPQFVLYARMFREQGDKLDDERKAFLIEKLRDSYRVFPSRKCREKFNL